ncbi:ComEC/Rec2 family competence protein [Thermodesulfobacteriota bacterium]
MKRFLAGIFILIVTIPSASLTFPGCGKEPVSFHFIDVGHGDATLVRIPGGRDILIDTGRLSRAAALCAYLEDQGVRKLDRLILTHPHPDHIGGVFAVVDAFSPASLHDNGVQNKESDIFTEYTKLIESGQSPYQVLKTGDSFSYGPARFAILNSPGPVEWDLNADSMVIRIEVGETAILIAADLNIRGEKRLLESGNLLRSQVLRVGHHGAQDATSDDFLAAVSPQTAIVSVGTNPWGYPSAELLDRLEKDPAIELLRTDRDGTIVVETDGREFKVSKKRSSPSLETST